MLARYIEDKSGHKANALLIEMVQLQPHSHQDSNNTERWLFTWKTDIGVFPLTFLSLVIFSFLKQAKMLCPKCTLIFFFTQASDKLGFVAMKVTYFLWGLFFIDVSSVLCTILVWYNFFNKSIFLSSLQGESTACTFFASRPVGHFGSNFSHFL